NFLVPIHRHGHHAAADRRADGLVLQLLLRIEHFLLQLFDLLLQGGGIKAAHAAARHALVFAHSVYSSIISATLPPRFIPARISGPFCAACILARFGESTHFTRTAAPNASCSTCSSCPLACLSLSNRA